MGQQRKGKTWLNEEDIILTKLWEAGATVAKISKALERTEKSTIARAHILFLIRPTPEYTVYQGEEVVAVGTLQACADKLGYCRSTLRHRLTPTGRKRDARHKASDNRLMIVKL